MLALKRRTDVTDSTEPGDVEGPNKRPRDKRSNDKFFRNLALRPATESKPGDQEGPDKGPQEARSNAKFFRNLAHRPATESKPTKQDPDPAPSQEKKKNSHGQSSDHEEDPAGPKDRKTECQGEENRGESADQEKGPVGSEEDEIWSRGALVVREQGLVGSDDIEMESLDESTHGATCLNDPQTHVEANFTTDDGGEAESESKLSDIETLYMGCFLHCTEEAKSYDKSRIPPSQKERRDISTTGIHQWYEPGSKEFEAKYTEFMRLKSTGKVMKAFTQWPTGNCLCKCPDFTVRVLICKTRVGSTGPHNFAVAVGHGEMYPEAFSQDEDQEYVIDIFNIPWSDLAPLKERVHEDLFHVIALVTNKRTKEHYMGKAVIQGSEIKPCQWDSKNLDVEEEEDDSEYELPERNFENFYAEDIEIESQGESVDQDTDLSDAETGESDEEEDKRQEDSAEGDSEYSDAEDVEMQSQLESVDQEAGHSDAETGKSDDKNNATYADRSEGSGSDRNSTVEETTQARGHIPWIAKQHIARETQQLQICVRGIPALICHSRDGKWAMPNDEKFSDRVKNFDLVKWGVTYRDGRWVEEAMGYVLIKNEMLKRCSCNDSIDSANSTDGAISHSNSPLTCHCIHSIHVMIVKQTLDTEPSEVTVAVTLHELELHWLTGIYLPAIPFIEDNAPGEFYLVRVSISNKRFSGETKNFKLPYEFKLSTTDGGPPAKGLAPEGPWSRADLYL
ncbi:hypothetical protein F5Y17DRAFT_463282 [Xylariaceae sp. FL0594]|nr:hypothetical protein F5Y17DRAFT_463282 [Xylariaceae sp. FL0594]